MNTRTAITKRKKFERLNRSLENAYEYLKKQLPKNLSADEYELECKRIAEELGI